MEIYNQLKKYSNEIQEAKSKIDNSIPFDKWVLIPKIEMLLENFYISGIYVLYFNGGIFYIGISKKIGQRIMTHLEYHNDLIYRIKIKRFKNWQLAELMEKKLINRIRPKNNKQIISKNVIRINKDKILKKITALERENKRIREKLGIKD